MNLITRKIILFITLSASGYFIAQIIKENSEGKELLLLIIKVLSSFLIGIGVWLRKSERSVF